MEANDLRLAGRVPTELRLLSVGVKARFEDAFDNPVFLMGNPAFALLVFDNGDKCWTRHPLDVWTRCAEAVAWSGVLPTDSVYDCGSSGAVSCMVALKSSPIWRRLGEVDDCADSRTDSNAKFMISNVGRSELRRMCAAAGIAEDLNDVRRVAMAVKDAQESVGGNGAYGASATTEGVAKSRRVVCGILHGGSESWLRRLINRLLRR